MMNEDLENQKKQLEEIDSIFETNEEIDEENFDSDQYSSLLSEFGLDINQLSDDMDSYSPTMPLRYSSSNESSVNPEYAYPTDSGFDLYSTEELYVESFGRTLVSTGLHFDIPDGYEIQVRSKSGLALKQGLMVLNSPGTVDQGYTGEIKVIIFNTSKETVKIEKGQKIAQAVVSPVVCGKWVNLVKVNDIEDKDRSDKGFGSTGI
jgi:dUTP pyrophosphatase